MLLNGEMSNLTYTIKGLNSIPKGQYLFQHNLRIYKPGILELINDNPSEEELFLKNIQK